MSGHSKWAQIKRQKGVADVKRGLTFTKIANAITIAVRQGGGVTDPSGNFRLRLAIDKARTVNMPKENIQRAIERALGKLAGELEEVVYEGFGPFGTAVIVEVATDNKQRTLPEIKNIFDKIGGSLGQPGTVSYLFCQMGMMVVEKGSKSFDEILSIAVDVGANDLEDAGNEVVVYTQTADLAKVRNLFESSDFNITSAELVRKPTAAIKVTNEQIQKIRAFVNKLEELGDVQKVYTNIEF